MAPAGGDLLTRGRALREFMSTRFSLDLGTGEEEDEEEGDEDAPMVAGYTLEGYDDVMQQESGFAAEVREAAAAAAAGGAAGSAADGGERMGWMMPPPPLSSPSVAIPARAATLAARLAALDPVSDHDSHI